MHATYTMRNGNVLLLAIRLAIYLYYVIYPYSIYLCYVGYLYYMMLLRQIVYRCMTTRLGVDNTGNVKDALTYSYLLSTFTYQYQYQSYRSYNYKLYTWVVFRIVRRPGRVINK